MKYERAQKSDEEGIKRLLAACGLPNTDIGKSHLEYFLVAREGSHLAAVVGLELLDRYGLLRSLAVQPRYRHNGIATQLVSMAEDLALSMEVESLYLFTISAENFFQKRGYDIIERITAPKQVKSTEEFINLCPENAVCLVKRLTSVG